MLGTGTSAGVPIIGCDCEVCTSTDPRDNRTRPAACVETIDPTGQYRVLLLDAGPDLRQQVLRHRIKRCDAILFTHHHVDHIFGLDEVRRFNVLMDAHIDVYAEARCMGNIQRVYRHIFESANNINKSFVATLIPNHIESGVPFCLFGLQITPIRLLHGRLPILGFRFDTDPALSAIKKPQTNSSGTNNTLPFAYCTDVSSVPPEAWGILDGVRTLILDALRFRHHPTHLTVDQAIEIAAQIGASRTYFTHMTHDILYAKHNAELPEGIAFGYDGLSIGSIHGY